MAAFALAGPVFALGLGAALAFEGPAREKPLSDPDLLDFTQEAVQAEHLSRKCPDLFTSEEVETAELALRWARAVARLPSYDIRLSLAATAIGAERGEAIAAMNCADPGVAALAEGVKIFIADAPNTVRTSEMLQ